jgi:hypothetical protein
MNIRTGNVADLATTPGSVPTQYVAGVVGQDKYLVCAAGDGIQNTFKQIFIVDLANPANTWLIDVPAKTINGVASTDPNWPTSGPQAGSGTIGIHSLAGAAGSNHVDVTFHHTSWSNGKCPWGGAACFNIDKKTWSLLRGDVPNDYYWVGHDTIGAGKWINGGGTIGRGGYGFGYVLRDPDDLSNQSKYVFVGQPPASFGHYMTATGEHVSWHNAGLNPIAPPVSMRYGPPASPPLWVEGEIYATAIDGSGTVYRFCKHRGLPASGAVEDAWAWVVCAQVSNDGRWVLFASSWDGMLGASASKDFGVSARLDAFILDLGAAPAPPLPPPPPPAVDPAL